MLHAVNTQHGLQRIGPSAIARLGIKRLDDSGHILPWQNLLHAGEENLFSGLTALSAEFTIGEGELMAHDVPLGCAPDEYDDLISGTCSHLPKVKVIKGTFWLLFKGEMLRRTLVAITVLIAMNISLYTITVWIPTIFVNSGIDVDKSILMTAVIMIGAPVGIFIAALIIDHFPRRLFGSTLLIIIAVLGYIYSIQTTEWAILIYGLVMIFFLYMYVCFASAVYIPELWPTHLRLRGSGFVNAVGRIVAVFTPYGVAALLTHYGSITVFMVLGVMLLLCALVLSIFGIETRKVSLEEISEVN